MAQRPYWDVTRILILSTFVDLALSVLKVVVGWLANSHALIADGIHSLSDLATDIMAWAFASVGGRQPDREHPYGHRRFETIGTVLLGGVLLTVAALLVYDSVDRLINITQVPAPGWTAMIAAAISIAVKEWLYQISDRVGKRDRSDLLVANAWHHRSDALSSIVVFLGVGGALLGATWLEMVASIVVAIMIWQIGWRFARQGVAELVDTGLPTEVVAAMEAQILAIEGVRGLHSLRTRKMGPDVMLDIHIQVDPGVSVSEGHHIGEWAQRELLANFSEIGDVVFHIDAEDDSASEGQLTEQPIAPMRAEVRVLLERAWEGLLDASAIDQITLHYLDHGIRVEVYLPLELLRRPDYDAESVRRGLHDRVEALDWIRQISVWYG